MSEMANSNFEDKQIQATRISMSETLLLHNDAPQL